MPDRFLPACAFPVVPYQDRAGLFTGTVVAQVQETAQ